MNYCDIIEKRSELQNKENTPFQILLNNDKIINWQKKRKAQLEEQSLPPEWAEIGVVFDDPYVVILRDLVEFPGGSRNGYIRLYNRAYLEGGAAGVAMLPEKNGKLLLMHQFRHATRSWHWEIPRGFGEPGIQAEDQARAEFDEEIGGEIAEMGDLGLYFNNTGLEGNPIYLFLVKIASIGEPKLKLGVDEFIWVSVTKLEEMIANAEITDGFTIAAYTRAKLKRLI
jgi:ADP-ribose pyrophosphatase